ncbi:glycosyltransferase family 4 protein [Pengzhenrongella sicca]|uniref:Glycosyltransferase family 4 protein n=1 Tax=Pengzhenrongella sicca TaxID=2819238 RepID=A0A8A4ZE98_9MICO|nr:glycosyltransferase family 1 protein [Pengzhenrongella sicca]QTE30234.1 glycosyltransferase family 4 protein [Pengzhenrongella sicca]
MRLVIDATALLGVRTGIGRYVEHLLRELPAAIARRDAEASLAISTWTRHRGRPADAPPAFEHVGLPVPATALFTAWERTDHPRIETLVGRCDVFHGTNFVSPPTRRAREVVTVHDLTYALRRDTVSATSRRYETLVARALDRGAQVAVLNETMAGVVGDFYGLEPGRVVATPLGVDDGWFTAPAASRAWLASRGLPPDYLVYVGSLDPRKNLPRLLDAHRRARSQFPQLPDLVLAGPAGRERDLGDRPGVHLTGWLNDGELQALVAGSRALVLASLDEGFGLPVLEALACGRPVVISDLPVLLEVSGGLGVAIAPTDTDALAEALIDVLEQPDGAADRDRRRAWARRWSWSTCADRTLDAYGIPA